MHFWKHRWKLFCWGLELFSAQCGKKPISLQRKIPKWPLHTKSDECRLFSENFAHSMKVSRSKYLIKKCFSRKKLPSCSFANVFCSFEIIPFFSLKLPEKIVESPREKLIFCEKKQLERSCAHIKVLSKTLPKCFRSRIEKFVPTVRTSNITFWRNVTTLFVCTHIFPFC